MKLKTLTFIVLASVAALTGCEDKTSVDWYMAHHDDMLAKYRSAFLIIILCPPIARMHAPPFTVKKLNLMLPKDISKS